VNTWFSELSIGLLKRKHGRQKAAYLVNIQAMDEMRQLQTMNVEIYENDFQIYFSCTHLVRVGMDQD